jgi:hypothetical protein
VPALALSAVRPPASAPIMAPEAVAESLESSISSAPVPFAPVIDSGTQCIPTTAAPALVTASRPPVQTLHAAAPPRSPKWANAAAQGKEPSASPVGAAVFAMPLPQPALSTVLTVPDEDGATFSPVPNAPDSLADGRIIPSASIIGSASDTAFSDRQKILPATTAAPAMPYNLSLLPPRGIPEPWRTSSVSEAGNNASPFDLVFSLRLRPLPTADATLSPAPPSAERPEVPAAIAAFPRPEMPPIVPVAPAAEAPSSTASPERSAPVPHIASHQPRSADADLAGVSVPTVEHAVALHVTGVVRSPEQEVQPGTPRSAPEPRPAATVEPPAPDTLKAPAPIRSLEFQLESDQGRVAVRLADRAGDVKVDVRTADNRLASALRGELPELAARIEQSGYRVEMWHPSVSPGADRGRGTESSALAGDSQNLSQGGRGNAQDQEQERRGWTEPKQPSPRKNNGKDFQWLFTSIR